MTKKLRDIVEANLPGALGALGDLGGLFDQRVDHSVASGVRRKRRAMNDFIGDHIENSNITHDGLRKKFKKVFGQKAHDRHFDKLISKHVD